MFTMSEGDADRHNDKNFSCDNQLLLAVAKLFEILEDDSLSSDASQKVELLVKEYPDAAGFHSNEHGGYALHLASWNGAPLHAIAALARAFPNALQECRRLKHFYEFPFGMYPLQQALSNVKASFDVIRFLASQWPGALQLPILVDNGYFALHLACERKVSLQIIQYLVQKWPVAIEQEAEHGLPLHYACLNGADHPTIDFLIQAWPYSLKVRNKTGLLPLHAACQCRDDYDEVSVWSEYAAVSNDPRRSKYLYIIAPSPPPPLMVLKTLVKAWPAAVRMHDAAGFLPLHHLCNCQQALLADVQLLVEACPDALQIATANRGMLPLHLACLRRLSTDVIQYLIKSFPPAVKERNREGHFPLHMACSKWLDVRVIESLIQVWPYSVSVSVSYDDIESSKNCWTKVYYDNYLKSTDGSDEESGLSMDVEEEEDEDDSHGMFTNYQGNDDDDDSHGMSMNDHGSDEEEADDGSHAIFIPDQEVDSYNEDYTDDDDDSDDDDESDNEDETDDEGDDRDTNESYHEDDETSVVCDSKRHFRHRVALDIVCDDSMAARPLTMEYVLLLTNGTPPLHFACTQPPCTSWFPYRKQTLKKLAALSAPEDWMHFHQGMLPLHCACRSQAEEDIIRWVSKKHPDALRICTTDTMDSPLHCYLSSKKPVLHMTTSATTHDNYLTSQSSPLPMYSFSTVRFLVKPNPVALRSVNRSGWLPIHLAAMHNASLNIMFYLACHNPESLLQGNV